MQRFCGDIAFSIDPLFRSEKVAIGQLAQLAGCDAAALEWVSVRHLGKGHFRLRDEFASLQSFQRLRVRVCPEWLCCTDPVWDSSHESSVVAGLHEQTHAHDLQDQELASLQ